MREEFEKLAATGKIQPKQIDALVKLTECGYCTHRSWGFGKITTVDTVFSRFLIDFESKSGHSMDLGFGADTLKPIPPEHIFVKKAKDMPGLREMAALHHVELIKLVIQSFGGSATVAQIQEVLMPDVIADDWRKWWEGVRKELKKDGHFRVPLKKSESIVFNAESVSIEERLLSDFQNARGLKARIAVAQEIARNHEDLADKARVFQKIADDLNEKIAKQHKKQPALALDGIFVRDDLIQLAGMEMTSDQVPSAKNIWVPEENEQKTNHNAETQRVAKILEQLPASRHKRALRSYKESCPDRWVDVVLGIINGVSFRLVGECVHLLLDSKQIDPFKKALANLINQHQASSDLLLWLAKSRSEDFLDILGPEVFRAMIAAMEQDQFKEKKTSRLKDYLLSDTALLSELIETADLEVVKDLTRTLKSTTCFDDMDKRSLLARVVKSYPAIQSLISGEPSTQEKGLIVSQASLERRREEYDQLIRKKIPANSKEIAIARSYGDLRENHEYKAAKEMQKLLMTRKTELEIELAKASATNFSDSDPSSVSIGTIVHVTDVGQQTQENFTILGAWDSDPDRGIISYLSPLAQQLIHCKPGDEVILEQHGGKKLQVNRIEKISEDLLESLSGTTTKTMPDAEASSAKPSPKNTNPKAETRPKIPVQES